MQCPYPVTITNPALKDCQGSLVDFDKDGNYVFDTGEVLPFKIQVPCGHCIVCQNNRRDAWTARMQLETLEHTCAWFVTLTYNEDSCPPYLCRADLTKWLKRFRRRRDFRYFACGEYGDLGNRPHFHVIMWFDELLQQVDIDNLLADTWKYGFTLAKPANVDNMRYVAKYTVKVFKEIPYPVPSPYAVMSRKPGIAGSWWQSNSKYFTDYLALPDGSHESLPRYFLEKLDPVEQIQVKRHARNYAELQSKLSDSEKQLRLVNLERSLYRRYVHKYGK